MALRDLIGWQASDRLEVLIDFFNVKQHLNKRLAGVALHALGLPVPIGGGLGDPQNRQPFDHSGNYVFHPALEAASKRLILPSTSVFQFGGMYWVHGNTGTIDPEGFASCAEKYAQLLGAIRSPSEGGMVSPFENDTNYPLPLSGLEALYGELSRRLYSRGIHYLEAVSKPYRATNSYFAAPTDYQAYHLQVFSAIKAAAPKMRVGLDLLADRDPKIADSTYGYAWKSVDWSLQMAADLAGKYNWIGTKVLGSEPGDIALAPWDTRTTLGTQPIRILETLETLNNYAPVWVTQYSFSPVDSATPSGGPPYDVRGSNILGVLFRANLFLLAADDSDVLGMNALTLALPEYSSWDPAFRLMSYQQPNGRSKLYWFHHYLNRFLGDYVLSTYGKTVVYSDTASSAPGMVSQAYRQCSLLPVLATKTQDDLRLYVIMANLHMQNSYPAKLTVSNFAPSGGSAWVLSTNAPNPTTEDGWDPAGKDPIQALPMAMNGSEVTLTLPPHSVVFVELRAEGAWGDPKADGRSARLVGKNPPAGATRGDVFVSKYPDAVFQDAPVTSIYPPDWSTEIEFDTWGLNYYGVEYNTVPPVLEGPHPVWDEGVFWAIRSAEAVYNELVRHVEALSSVGAPHDTDPVVVHFGLARSLQPPYIAISVPSVNYEMIGYPLQKWGTALIEIEICTKLGGISQPYLYHNTLTSAVVDILNRLVKQQIDGPGFFADRIDIAGPVSDVEESENVVLTTFVTMTCNVIYDAYNK